MANAVLGNKIYIDTTGVISTERIKVAYILFTPDNASDELEIKETETGANAFYARAATAKDTILFDFSQIPLVFNNGIYISTLSTGAKVVLVTTSGSR